MEAKCGNSSSLITHKSPDTQSEQIVQILDGNVHEMQIISIVIRMARLNDRALLFLSSVLLSSKTQN